MRSLIPENKKGGVTTSTVFAVGGLVIGVLVMLIIVQTVTNADLLGTTDTQSVTVSNESADTAGVTVAYLNETGYVLSGWNSSWSSIAMTIIWNLSASDTYNVTIGTDNATIAQATGTVTNATSTYDGLENVSLTYTYTYTAPITDEKYAVQNMTENFTDGIDEVSSKLPTILLIVAVIFLFAALALLIRNAKAMGIGESSL